MPASALPYSLQPSRRSRRGSTAIEYALIAGLVAVMVLSATRQVGLQLSFMLDRLNSHLSHIPPVEPSPPPP